MRSHLCRHRPGRCRFLFLLLFPNDDVSINRKRDRLPVAWTLQQKALPSHQEEVRAGFQGRAGERWGRPRLWTENGERRGVWGGRARSGTRGGGRGSGLGLLGRLARLLGQPGGEQTASGACFLERCANRARASRSGSSRPGREDSRGGGGHTPTCVASLLALPLKCRRGVSGSEPVSASLSLEREEHINSPWHPGFIYIFLMFSYF